MSYEWGQPRLVALKNKNITPEEGVAYDFSDGLYVVTDVIGNEVYMLGPDDEEYMMTIKEFREEVIGFLEEKEDEKELNESVFEDPDQSWKEVYEVFEQVLQERLKLDKQIIKEGLNKCASTKFYKKYREIHRTLDDYMDRMDTALRLVKDSKK